MFELRELNEDEVEEVESRLEAYDQQFLPKPLDGTIQIGAFDGTTLVGGLDASMTSFKILYISTVHVAESHRRKGIGRLLMLEAEKRAKALGADMIRLDTFNWQGREFYQSIGYQEVGFYQAKEFSEHFFLKRLK